MLGWILRESSRAALDLAGTALDNAASALHRAAGEPSAVAEMRRERDELLGEVDRLREAERAISDLYDYATDAADLDSLDGTIHMPTRIREAIDSLTEKRDEAFEAERDAVERARLYEAETGRWKERAEELRRERDEARRLVESYSARLDDVTREGRDVAAKLSGARRERDEARADLAAAEATLVEWRSDYAEVESERDKARAECERLRHSLRAIDARLTQWSAADSDGHSDSRRLGDALSALYHLTMMRGQDTLALPSATAESEALCG